jgi:hypothetical protein
MAAGEFRLHQAVIGAATVLEEIRVICDRTHEENILASREGRDIGISVHYAYALGTVMHVALQELKQLQDELGIRREQLHEQADARARASLEAFKRQIAAIDLELQRRDDQS